MPLRSFFAGLLVLASAASAHAGAPPPADLPTDVIAPFVPRGWVSASYSSGEGKEFAEFIPAAQTPQSFTDLVGYTRSPILPGAAVHTDVDLAATIKAQQAGRCTTGTVRALTPAGSPAGWRFVQAFCLLKSGPAAGQIDVTFNAVMIRPTALFTVWRTWRGSPEAFRRFMPQVGRVYGDPLSGPASGVRFTESVIDRAAPAILSAWSETFTRVELCDLAQRQICPSYRATAAEPPSVIAVLTLPGSHQLTTDQALAVEAGLPGAQGKMAQDLLSRLQHEGKAAAEVSFSQSISLSNHDWSAPAGYAAAILAPLLGSRSSGGVLTALDATPPADPAVRARMQAYMVAADHLLWKFGVAPDREALALTP